jgi:hypothetical protein
MIASGYPVGVSFVDGEPYFCFHTSKSHVLRKS